MARYTGPKTRIARKFGEAIYGADKAFEKRKYAPVSTVTAVAARLLSMVSCLLRSRKLNIPMAFLRNSSAICLTRHHARAASLV